MGPAWLHTARYSGSGVNISVYELSSPMQLKVSIETTNAKILDEELDKGLREVLESVSRLSEPSSPPKERPASPCAT